MSSQSRRRHHFASNARRQQRARFAQLNCEQFEDRITPALFTVQNPLSFTGLNNNGCVATADFNHDGLSDAVLANFGTDYASGAGNTITILYAKQGGGFNKVNLSAGGTNVSFVAVGDINGDGYADVVSVNENKQNAGSVSVFKNDGAGNLSLAGTFSSSSNDPSWVGLADVTGDGALDIVVGSFGVQGTGGQSINGNNITIFQGNTDVNGHGNFTFSSSPITTLAPDVSFTPTSLAIADFNGDGIMDIAAVVPGVGSDIGQPQPDGNVWIFQGTGSGGFGSPNSYDTGGVLPVNVQAADVNGDHLPDLVIANAGDPNASPEFSGDSVGVMLNVSGSTNVSFGVVNSLTTNCHGTFATAVADFNQDGKLDIAAVNYGAQLSSQPAAFVSLYMGNGSGSFTPGSPGTYDTKTNFGGGQYLAVGDFDGNGTPDLIVAHASNLVGLLLNTSAAQTTTSTALASSANPSNSGQSVTFTATVTPSSGTVPGGTVSFFDGATQLGSPVNLVSQQATLQISTLTAGNHSITAVYSGTTGFAGSTSTALKQVVNAAQVPTFSFSGLPPTTTAGSSIGFTLTVKDQNGVTITGYVGTVHFTSTDGAASLPANYTFIAGDNGVHAFSSSTVLKTAGNQTITATDTVTSSTTATSSPITVNPGAAAHFVVGAPGTAVAGTSFSVSITAQDQFNNTATGYGGTLHFSSSDGKATLPGNAALTNGAGTFSATLNTQGSQTITATDTATSSITGVSSSIAVSAGSSIHFVVSAVANATAGTAFSFSVTAQDQFNNTAASYSGIVHFTSSDVQAVLPADVSLSSGTGTFNATLKTSGNQTITATDTVTASETGASSNIVVSAGVATHLVVAAPASAAAGTAFNFTVTAQDQFNNTATGYTGVLHFSSSDASASLPANASLTNGTGTFSATAKTVGNQTVTATDTATSSITGTSGTVAVNPGAATHFVVSAAASAAAGTAFNFTVTAQDQFNNTATAYSGTLHFTSSDTQATLPANTTLTSGTGTFSATLKTTGSQTVTATDTASSSIKGTSSAITVSPGVTTHFLLTPPASAAAGTSFSFSVTAQDQFNNTTTAYNGTVHFTSSDAQATLAANATLTNGKATFSATLKTAGSQTITGTDTTTSSITGTSTSITVNPGTTTHFTFATPASAVAGTAFNFTVKAMDQFNNTVTNYGNKVKFTSSDAQATLPGNSSFVNGIATLSATMKTAGSQTMTATEISSSGLTGSSSAIPVSAGAVASATFTQQPTNSASGVVKQPSVSVSLFDQFSNQVTTGSSQVSLALGSPSGNASLGGTTTVTSANGAAVFSNLVVTGSGIGLTLQASINGVKIGTSATFNSILTSNILPVVVAADIYGPHPNTSQQQAYIKGIYRTLLGRDADTNGLNYWLGQFNAGVSHAALINSFWNSPENRTREVNTYYQVFLGRAADPQGLGFWVQQLTNGVDETAIVFSFLLSPEELQATNEVFIQRLYQGTLSRPASSSDLTYWEGQLAQGVTRQQVAADFVFSGEAAGIAVDSDYGAYLQRAADANGRASWVSGITSQKTTYASVAISLLASDEFFANAAKEVP